MQKLSRERVSAGREICKRKCRELEKKLFDCYFAGGKRQKLSGH